MTSRCLHCGAVIQGLAQFCDNCASLDDDPFTPKEPAQPGEADPDAPVHLGPVAPSACPHCAAPVPDKNAYFCAACNLPVRAMEYAGFGIRFLAAVVDAIIGLAINLGIIVLVGDSPSSIALQIAVGALYTIGFWIVLGATPGKLAVGVRLVTTKGEPLELSHCILRYLGYIASALTLLIGYLMIGFHPQKRGLHDLIGGTVVVRVR